MTMAREWSPLALAVLPLAAIAVTTGRLTLALPVIVAGAAVLWPMVSARYGIGVGVSATVAVLYATFAYGLALEPLGREALAFAAGAIAVVAARGPRRSELAAAIAAVFSIALAPAGAAVIAYPLVLAFRGPRSAATLWALAIGLVAALPSAPWLVQDGLLDGLFSSPVGPFFWSPILWLAALGLALGLERGRSWAAAVAALVATALLGAITGDSGSVRGARFAPLLPLLCLGLARSLAAIRDVAMRRPLAPVAAMVAAFVAWNALLMAQYRDGPIPRDNTVAFEDVAGNAAGVVSGTVGTPTAWPANWVFATRYDLEPARYDLLGGWGPGVGPELPLTIEVGDPFTDPAVLEGAWSVRHPCGKAVCREIAGKAVVLVPLRRGSDPELTIHVAGKGALRMSWQGSRWTAPFVAHDSAEPVPIHLRGGLRHGVNRLVLEVAPGGRIFVDRIDVLVVDPR